MGKHEQDPIIITGLEYTPLSNDLETWEAEPIPENEKRKRSAQQKEQEAEEQNLEHKQSIRTVKAAIAATYPPEGVLESRPVATQKTPPRNTAYKRKASFSSQKIFYRRHL